MILEGQVRSQDLCQTYAELMNCERLMTD